MICINDFFNCILWSFHYSPQSCSTSIFDLWLQWTQWHSSSAFTLWFNFGPDSRFLSCYTALTDQCLNNDCICPWLRGYWELCIYADSALTGQYWYDIFVLCFLCSFNHICLPVRWNTSLVILYLMLLLLFDSANNKNSVVLFANPIIIANCGSVCKLLTTSSQQHGLFGTCFVVILKVYWSFAGRCYLTYIWSTVLHIVRKFENNNFRINCHWSIGLVCTISS